ncbi:MAG: hypothetical protein V1754_09385 [Pseudomonadota bacterium]
MKTRVLCLFALAVLLSSSEVGQARDRMVEDVFAGEVIILARRAPSKIGSRGAFIKFLKGNRKNDVWSARDDRKKWRVEFMAFFENPLNDVEVKFRIYDITEGKKYVAGDSFFTPRRGERILASNVLLEADQGFSPNRKYFMQLISGRNKLLAKTTFWLRGKGEEFTGKVTFSDEEAKIVK